MLTKLALLCQFPVHFDLVILVGGGVSDLFVQVGLEPCAS
jgi:hypothetical protein